MFGKGTLRRLPYDLFRSLSRSFRAQVDLFEPEYEQRVDWRSGLDDAVYLLHGVVRATRPETIVEIGSARGKSTCAMALACRQNSRGKVYAIDPHSPNPWSEYKTDGDNERFLRGRLHAYGLEPWCEVLRATSEEIAAGWSRPIDLLFIDGDHSYDGVRRDFESFRPWLSDAALVIFHDTTWQPGEWDRVKQQCDWPVELGVPRFMGELKRAGYRSVSFPPTPGLTILDPRPGGYEFANLDGSAMQAVAAE